MARSARLETRNSKLAVCKMAEQKHTYDYHIDRHGNWFCEGNPVSDPALFRILSRSLFREREGYFVRCEGEVHPVRVDDAPLWVRYVHVTEDRQGELLRLAIELKDGRGEELDADSLSAVRDALYCLATQEKLTAKFGKSAYYEITRYLREDTETGEFYFIIGGRRHAVWRPDAADQSQGSPK